MYCRWCTVGGVCTEDTEEENECSRCMFGAKSTARLARQMSRLEPCGTDRRTQYARRMVGVAPTWLRVRVGDVYAYKTVYFHAVTGTPSTDRHRCVVLRKYVQPQGEQEVMLSIAQGIRPAVTEEGSDQRRVCILLVDTGE